jgi:hypothetical protein
MSCDETRLSSESCSGYENPSEETPCRFESGPGHQKRVLVRVLVEQTALTIERAPMPSGVVVVRVPHVHVFLLYTQRVQVDLVYMPTGAA